MMATRTVDAVGLRCPQPILQLTLVMPEMKPGDVVELKANCENFEPDIRQWCERLKKTLLAITTDAEGIITATIQF